MVNAGPQQAEKEKGAGPRLKLSWNLPSHVSQAEALGE